MQYCFKTELLVHLNLGSHSVNTLFSSILKNTYLAGVNAHMDCCAISLFPLYPLNVDDVFLPVNLDDFANLLTFIVPSHDLNTYSKIAFGSKEQD
jgi:hypothetical protein